MDKNQLKQVGISNRKKFRQAIQQGDKEKALALLDETARNEAKLRTAIVSGVDVLLSFIGDRMGEEAVYEAMRAWYNKELKSFVGSEAGEPDAEKRMIKRAYIWTGLHDVDISVEEDDEKFTVKFPCDTGGMLVAKGTCGKTKDEHFWANQEKGIAYYCTHCTVSYQVMFAEDFGFPNFIVSPPKKAGDLCVQRIYKDSAKIPTEYHKRFPKRKPKA